MNTTNHAGAELFYQGDITLLGKPSIAVIGTREADSLELARARKVAKELVKESVVIVSGLARGIDTAALTSAIEHGGKVIAVIGTPLDKFYPYENKKLQQLIAKEHLLISQFPVGSEVSPRNFPMRNRVMANISDASVVVATKDGGGTLTQADYRLKTNKKVFVMASTALDPNNKWPQRYIDRECDNNSARQKELLRLRNVDTLFWTSQIIDFLKSKYTNT